MVGRGGSVVVGGGGAIVVGAGGAVVEVASGAAISLTVCSDLSITLFPTMTSMKSNPAVMNVTPQCKRGLRQNINLKVHVYPNGLVMRNLWWFQGYVTE